jgi:peptidylprolyl isomerase
MKLLSVLHVRSAVRVGFLLAMMGIVAGSTAVKAEPPATNAPATNAPPAPAGAASQEIDKETGKPIVTTPSGLKYVDVVPGKGDAAKLGDHLVVNYIGTLADGTKFDSSYDRGRPMDLILGQTQLIQGWTEGLQGIKAGGKRKLIIPPQLGYGLNGYADLIPPNATLIFVVELVAISNANANANAK